MPALREIRISGPPRARGRAHGRALADDIAALTAERVRLCADGEWAGADLGRRRVLELAGACWAAHEAFDAPLTEELAGIAEGAGVDPVELLIANGFTDFVDLLYASGRAEAGVNTAAPEAGGCTAVLIHQSMTRDGRPYLAQTWDMHASATPFVILLDVRPPDEPAVLTFTLTGCVGMIGLNDAGLAVGINNLRTADGRVGVTWPFVVRKMLRQTAIEDALAIPRDAPLAGAHNYLLLDGRGRGFNVEATPTRRDVTELTDWLAHTNHCLAPGAAALERPRTAAAVGSSSRRLALAQRYLQERAGRIDAETLMTMTRLRGESVGPGGDGEGGEGGDGAEAAGYGICAAARPGYAIETSGACVMSPASGELWAVWGRPSRNDYERFSFERTAGEGVRQPSGATQGLSGGVDWKREAT